MRSWKRRSRRDVTMPMGILPGGTGNGFAREMGVPGTLREATEVLCTSSKTRAVDVGRLRDLGQAKVADRYFVQRLYVGVEPEEQTSRELKDKYGVFAYLGQCGRARARHDGHPLPRRAGRRVHRVRRHQGLRRQLRDDGDRAPDHPYVLRR